MKKKMLSPKDKKLQEYIKKGGRKEAKKDFLKLLKKASTP